MFNELIDFTRTEEVLRQYAQAASELYKDKLEASGRLATGDLIQSVSATVRTKGGASWEVVLENLKSYWRWVEEDTQPHWAPKGCLINWIKVKPIVPRPQKLKGKTKTYLPTVEQLDFLIRRKIAREGTKGTHDMANTVQEMNAIWLPKIREALAADYGQSLFAVIKGFNGVA